MVHRYSLPSLFLKVILTTPLYFLEKTENMINKIGPLRNDMRLQWDVIRTQ